MPSHNFSLPELRRIVFAEQDLRDAEKAYLKATSPSNVSFDASLLGDLAMRRLDAEEFLKGLTAEERRYVGQFLHYRLRLKCRLWIVEKKIGQMAKRWSTLSAAEVQELGSLIEEREEISK